MILQNSQRIFNKVMKGNGIITLLFYYVLKIKGYLIIDIRKEILKSIQIMIDKKLDTYKADITYESIIKNITPKIMLC